MTKSEINAGINAEIGRAVRLARNSKGMTITACADGVGCTQPELTRLERGQQTWTAPMILRVATFLGVRVELLFPALPREARSAE